LQSVSTSPPPIFEAGFKARLRELLLWRRDVRRFERRPLAEGALAGLIEAACLAPSIGLSQPWRFVVVDDPGRRGAIVENFRQCNREALAAYAPEQAAHYARLKLAGLEEAPCHLAVFADEATAVGHGLGRRTMPEMLRYSVVAAICNLWLAARAEGIGVGWISILDPERARRDLDVPESWRLIGYFCLGYPAREDDAPELQREGWERRRGRDTFVFQR
jgi:5,6-dimethylbenzimidazole synthase